MPALDDLGVMHAVRVTPAGAPYAGFELVGPSGRPRSLTAIAQGEGQVLRLTAHDLEARPLPDLMALTRTLPLGRALRSPDTGAVEFVLSGYVGEGLLSSQLNTLLRHIESALDAMDGLAPSPSAPVIATEGEAPLPGLADAAARRGSPVLDGDGVRVEFVMDEWSCHLSAELTRGGWVMVRGAWDRIPSGPSSDADWDTLQRLQNWTAAGRYVLLEDGSLGVEVGTPVLRHDVNRCADWSMSQATLMLQVAAQHLSPAASNG